jgi:hypothetical protein
MITSAYNNPLSAHGANAAYRAQSTGKISASAQYLEIMGGPGTPNSAPADTADISGAARDMLSRVKNLDIFSLIYPNNDATKATKTLGEVEDDFLGDFNDFSFFFGKMSGMMGLSPDDSFTMGLDGVGGMTVSGTDAGAAAKLQEGFGGNQTLTARFAVMAARAALTDAGATEPGFADAYAEDPVAAIENNIGALKDRLLGFRTVAGGGETQYGFVRNKNMEIEYADKMGKYEAA